MQTNFLYPIMLAIFLLCGELNAQQSKQNSKPVPGTNDEWLSQAKDHVSKMEYDIKFISTDRSFSVFNRANKLSFSIRQNGYSVYNVRFQPGDESWNVDLHIKGIGRGDQLVPFTSSAAWMKNTHALTYSSPLADIEYINDASGLRQNFIVKQKPAGNDQLQIGLDLATSLVPVLKSDSKIVFHKKGDPKAIRLIYDGLKVWDANGKILEASLELKNNNVNILVDDNNAVYPITVDPLNHSPEWTTSADGVLPGLLINLQLQVDAIYGYSVAGVGDVNGDGFDDVAVGAPGAIDVIAGPINVAAAGAVFVYFGSPAGLPVVPSKILRSSTPIANALFGFSIAGGNVTGDSRNDIVVGAPGESYTANVGGVPSTATVVAGKVYVFRGEDLSAAGNPAPFLSVYLNGSGFFSNGIIGILASNTSINALFGFSIAVTEDMGTDGLGEIIVGSPGYAEATVLPLLPIRAGTALVYYSTNLATNTPVQLSAPTASLLGIPLLPEGLLFGFSVDGLGDYNMDGEPDVVVGAPAGVNLVPPSNLLGGSAYIFTGIAAGGGINTTHYAHLRATPSLIGTVANLFGYSVRGVRDATGVRNGNVLVGAPSGSVLSNVLGGLRLKTGSVNVYTRTSAAPNASGEIPDQAIPSPRGNSLLTILTGQDLEVSVLFGASIDNMMDVNCDGIGDIIVGEPVSTGVGIINTNAVGGAADIFIGNADGTYQTSLFWNLFNDTDFPFGINAGSLLGYSVAGGGHVRGTASGVRAIIGAPGAALDFSTGIFNLGATFGTLFDFAIGDNGLGKAYAYAFDNCGMMFNPDVNVTWVNIPVPGDVTTNDNVPAGTTYGTPVPNGGNPPGANINMNSDGTYTFTSPVAGVFYYMVPSCIPGQGDPCPLVELKITVLEVNTSSNPPVANTDLATTKAGNPVILNSLSNDRCSNIGCNLNPASVTVTVAPSNGTTSVNPATGEITYTPDPGFTGRDTLTYEVCDNGAPPKCATAIQVITVYAGAGFNTTNASDDYVFTQQGVAVNGNAKLNDTDPEGNAQTVTAQNTTIPGQGTFVLNADGTFTFTPEAGFSGPVDLPYTTCDNGTPSVCADATIYVLVRPLGIVPVTLLDFQARQKLQTVELKWSTVQEDNLSHFEVMRSLDGVNYQSIGTVFAIGGSGRADYLFTDVSPIKGNNYYKLRMIDHDARTKFSDIALVKLVDKNSTLISVAPNPIQHDYRIRMVGLEKGSYRVELVNSLGQIQMTKRVIINEFDHVEYMTRDPKLAPGMYWLSIIDEKTNSRIKQLGVLVSKE